MLQRFTIIPLLFALGTTPALASPLSPSSGEKSALAALAKAIPGARVLWVRGNKVFQANAADGFATKLLTQGSISESNPRFSPDGKQLLTVRADGVYLMRSDYTGAKKVISGGHTASWTRDGKSITCIDSTNYKVLQYSLDTQTTKTIYDTKASPYNGQAIAQAAELRKGGRYLLVFRRTPTHVTEIVDLSLKKYITNAEFERGDCSPAWAPDGSYTLTTARTSSRPVMKTTFNGGSLSASKELVGLDTSEKFYIHGQRVSNDGRYIAFGGKIFAGAMQTARREIYVWRIGAPYGDAVRISFDTEEDENPELFIPSTAGCSSNSECSDGDPCTADSCSSGKCQHSAISGCCISKSECDDGDLCTADSCSSNKCQHSAISGCCTKDADCGDGDPCTADVCSDNACRHSAISGCCTSKSQCDDGNLCTNDACSNNKCVRTAVPGCCSSNSDCDDGSPCTADKCDTGSGSCSNTLQADCCTVDTDCDDGVVCTRDRCTDGVCSNTAISGCCAADSECDDKNACTTDRCDVASGSCSNQAVGDCCLLDTECDDDDPCTLDRCDADHRCQHVASCSSEAGPPAADHGIGAPRDAGPEVATSPPPARSGAYRLEGGCAFASSRQQGGLGLILLFGLLICLVGARRRQSSTRS